MTEREENSVKTPIWKAQPMLPSLKQRGPKPCTEARTLVPMAILASRVKARADIKVLKSVAGGERGTLGGPGRRERRPWTAVGVLLFLLPPVEVSRASVACNPNPNSSNGCSCRNGILAPVIAAWVRMAARHALQSPVFSSVKWGQQIHSQPHPTPYH